MNQKATVLEDFLDFEEYFVQFIKNSALFKSAIKAQFVIYNEAFNEITYSYKYQCEDTFEVSDIKEMTKNAEEIFTQNYIHILLEAHDTND